MSLKDIGELKNSINILKNFSSQEAISGSNNAKLGKTAFEQIKNSLKDLTPANAVKKLNTMKLDPNLSKDIMKAADKGKLLKGSADEIATAIQGIGTTAPAVSGLTSVFKGLMATLATNPLTWVVAGVATIAGIVKRYDSNLGKQEELARARLEELEVNIKKYDKEITSLETLQTKLQATKGNTSELAKIQSELNDAIGETKGLLDDEGNAYDIANAKLSANIALKEKQREQANKEKAETSKQLFDNNVFEVKWGTDYTAEKMRNEAKSYQKHLNEFSSLPQETQQFYDDADDYARKAGAATYFDGWDEYWNEQVQIAYDAFDGYIQDYEGAGGQDFVKNLINNLVRSGADFSEISKVVQEVTNNEEMQNAINSYWESLVNPDMDSEKSAKEIKDVFNKVTQSFPSLESFFTQFYNDIISGGDGAYVSLLGVNNATTALATSVDKLQSASSGISSLSKAFQELSEDSRISIDTISEIKDAVGDSIPNWEHYQTQLLNAKAGSSEFNQIMSELTYAVLKEQLGVEGLANATEDEISAILNENGVLNASAVAHDIVTQKTKDLADTKAQEYLKTQDNITVTSDNIESLITQATAAGVSTNAYLQLLAKQILFDNTGIDTSSKCAQILAIANAANIATVQMGTLDTEIQTVAGKKLGSGARTAYAESKGVKVIAEKNRTDKNAKGNGNLYIVGDKEFEDFDDAMYYAEAYNTQQKIANLTPQITLPEYSLPSSSSTTQSFKESFNWIETALSRVQRAITNFGKTVAATWQSWKVRNTALKDQMSAIRNEISLQEQAYNKYMSLANSVGLSEGYKTLVRDGAIDISTIKSESIAEAIKLYQEYYEKALAAKDASADLKDKLAALAQTKFSNLAQSFADLMSGNEHSIGMYEATIELMEKRGYTASASLYDSLKEAELKNQDILKEKYQSLSQALDEAVSSGAVVKYSEQWYQIKNTTIF